MPEFYNQFYTKNNGKDVVQYPKDFKYNKRQIVKTFYKNGNGIEEYYDHDIPFFEKKIVDPLHGLWQVLASFSLCFVNNYKKRNV